MEINENILFEMYGRKCIQVEMIVKENERLNEENERLKEMISQLQEKNKTDGTAKKSN